MSGGFLRGPAFEGLGVDEWMDGWLRMRVEEIMRGYLACDLFVILGVDRLDVSGSALVGYILP